MVEEVAQPSSSVVEEVAQQPSRNHLCQTQAMLIKLAIFAALFLLVVWAGVKMLRR